MGNITFHGTFLFSSFCLRLDKCCSMIASSSAVRFMAQRGLSVSVPYEYSFHSILILANKCLAVSWLWTMEEWEP